MSHSAPSSPVQQAVPLIHLLNPIPPAPQVIAPQAVNHEPLIRPQLRLLDFPSKEYNLTAPMWVQHVKSEFSVDPDMSDAMKINEAGRMLRGQDLLYWSLTWRKDNTNATFSDWAAALIAECRDETAETKILDTLRNMKPDLSIYKATDAIQDYKNRFRAKFAELHDPTSAASLLNILFMSGLPESLISAMKSSTGVKDLQYGSRTLLVT